MIGFYNPIYHLLVKFPQCRLDSNGFSLCYILLGTELQIVPTRIAKCIHGIKIMQYPSHLFIESICIFSSFRNAAWIETDSLGVIAHLQLNYKSFRLVSRNLNRSKSCILISPLPVRNHITPCYNYTVTYVEH